MKNKEERMEEAEVALMKAREDIQKRVKKVMKALKDAQDKHKGG